MKRVMDITEKTIGVIIIVFLATMLSLMTIQITLRYVFSFSLFWVEEVCRVLFVWASYLGASVGLRRAELANVGLVLDRIKGKFKSVLLVTQGIFILIILLVILKYGLKLSIRTYTQFLPATMIPMFYAYISIPVASVLMIVFTLEKMVREITGQQLSTTPNLFDEVG